MTKPTVTRWFFVGVALAAAFVAARACGQVVMYEFESPDCVACRSREMLATIAQLQAEGVDVRPADISLYREAFEEIRHPAYRSVPQFVVTSGNQVVARAVGAQPIDVLRTMWQKGQAAAGAGVSSPQRVVCRVMAYDGQSSDGGQTYSNASGVIAQRNLVLTNAHAVRDAKLQPVVQFADGESQQARILGVDQALDLCALEVNTGSRRPIELADALPPAGTPIVAAGNVHGQYQEFPGQVAGYAGLGSPPEFLQVTTSRPVRQGDSGGPLIDGRGQLVGVLFGQRDNLVHGANCCRVRDFLRRVLGRDPKPSLPATFTPPTPPTPPTPQQPQQPQTAPAATAATPAPLEPVPAKPSEMQQPAAPVVEVPSEPASTASIGATPQVGATCPVPPAGNVGPPAGNAAQPNSDQAKAPASDDSTSTLADLLATAAQWALTRGLVSIGVPGGAAAAGASAVLWLVRWRRKRGAASGSSTSSSSTAPPAAQQTSPTPAPAPSPSPIEAALAAENQQLREQLTKSQQTVVYSSPPIGDNLPRMRQAMQLASDQRPECRKWVKFFEEVYKQLLGGETNAGSNPTTDSQA